LKSPLPVISELSGRDITFLDLAETLAGDRFNVGFIRSLIDIVEFINDIPTDLDSLWLNFGDLTVYGGTGNDLDLTSKSLNLGRDLDLNKAIRSNADPLGNTGSNSKAKDLFSSVSGNNTGGTSKYSSLQGAFEFPIIQDVTQIFNLLLGKPATLIKFDMPELQVGFEYSKFFRIYGPLGARIGGSLGATIDFDFGFDTYGIQRFVESGFVNPALIFGGFYIDDGNHPEIKITGSLTAAAELNLVVAYGGVGGGVFATMNFDLYDPDFDGRVRIDEIFNTIAYTWSHYADNPALQLVLSPLSIFDISGNVTAKLFWYVGVDLLLVSWEYSGTIAEFKLFDFEIDFPRAPILASDIGSGVLQLNMGDFADQRLNGNTLDGNESFEIEDTGAGVKVTFNGDTQTYTDIDTVVIRAGDGDDRVILKNSSTLNFDIEGGGGNDFIDVSKTTGKVRVSGNEGDDTIKTGSGDDIIWGNLGNDHLESAGGKNWIFGDDAKLRVDRETGRVEYIKVRASDGDGKDTIIGGSGDEILIGGGGADDIEGSNGADLILGDGGLLYFNTSGQITSVEETERGLIGGADILKGGAGDDTMYGGLGNDIINGDSGNDILYGEGGSDSLSGGDGNDVLHGGENADRLLGEAGNDTLWGGNGADSLSGGDGNDILYGERGTDSLSGDAGNDTLWGGSDPDLLHGGDGDDVLDGEAGDDLVYGDGGDDRITSRLDSDVLDGGEGSDTYTVDMSGGLVEKHVTVFDSGTGGQDELTINGTDQADRFLLRAGLGDEALAFVAMLNDDGAVERLDYNRQLEKLRIFGWDGDDRFALDDNRSETEIDGGLGKDTFQVGQMFVTPRTVTDADIRPHDGDMPHDGSDEADTDVFATIETTRGFLSNGVSKKTVLKGGGGNDALTVFHNLAELELQGGDGDDTFTVRAFALAGSQEPNRERTQIQGGDGADLIQYAENAPVDIDGGDGFDTVRIIGTEFSDDFLVTSTGVSLLDFDADGNLIEPVKVNFANIESLHVDGAEGDDRFFVLGTPEGTTVTLTGALGSDSFNLGLDYEGKAPQRLDGIQGLLYLEGMGESERSIGSLGEPLMLPGETNQKDSLGTVLAATADTIQVDPGTVQTIANLIDMTLEITAGPAKGQARLVTAYDEKSGLITVDEPWDSGSWPDQTSEFALSDTNPNLLVDESVQIDIVTAFDTDNTTGLNGTLTAERLIVSGMGNIDYTGMENFTLNLGSGNDQLSIKGTHTREDSYRTVTFINAGAGNDNITVTLDVNQGFIALNGEVGNDRIDASGSALGIIAIGGDGADTLKGGQGQDILLGDHGRIDYLDDDGEYVVTRLGLTHEFDNLAEQVPVTDETRTPANQTDGVVRAPNLILSLRPDQGGDDDLSGGGGNDVIIGGFGADTIAGDAGHDLIFGDHASLEGTLDLNTLPIPEFTYTSIHTLDNDDGGDDLIRAGSGDDIVLGQQGADRIYGEDGDDDLVGGHNVSGGHDAGDSIDGGRGNDVIAGDNAEITRSGETKNVRFRALDGNTLYDAAGRARISTAYQNDPDGGILREIRLLDHTGDTDVWLYGDDLIAGGADNDQLFGQLGDDLLQGDGDIDQAASATVDAQGVLNVAPARQTDNDGDDYIEGNGGDDILFGGLGQDDLIGGSSHLFGLTEANQRIDGSDLIFGGTGAALDRNDLGSGNHTADSDMILGDNGAIFRIVKGDEYVRFQYDQTQNGVVRTYSLLDYTPGVGGIGAGDELHGEDGDDILHGMTGNDVLFGEAGDDDLYGGSGHDRLYGGSGSDGILGDDGLIHTSRNGTAEPLHGVGSNREDIITMPGKFIGAIVYPSGLIHKSVTQLAYGAGAAANGNNGNDVIYGGLGDDFLHGGEGDDAISGAEALAAYYHSQPNVSRISGNYDAERPLPYESATGKFSAYNANDPRTKIDGFLLNFEATDASGNKIEDGMDRIFGGLGNDWLVGGTGRDRMFGGWGNDLLNADDNLDADNNKPDADAFADGDFAFGGAGLDVLIANTGRDRLFDWSGEFNSYFVPFSQFGEPTVTRQVSPQTIDFLKALGGASGADTSLSEPFGELGLVTQKDAAWNDQQGKPRDPQPGTINGVRVDDTGAPESRFSSKAEEVSFSTRLFDDGSGNFTETDATTEDVSGFWFEGSGFIPESSTASSTRAVINW
jgi:Ca2+-binding RTX toxin-like protein